MDLKSAKRIIHARYPKAYVSRFEDQVALLAGEGGIELYGVMDFDHDFDTTYLWLQFAERMRNGHDETTVD